MSPRKAKGEFDDLCQQYTTWIHEYISPRFDSPLYMVWLSDTTDEEQKDKFILSEEKKIVTATTPTRLLDVVKNLKTELPDDKNTREWLIRAYLSEPSPSYTDDIKYLEASIAANQLDQDFMSEMTNFINIVGDLGHQLEDDDLLDLTWDNSLRDLWDFFYDNAFWPRWGHEDTFDESKVPKFEPDHEELVSDFNLLVHAFESRIEIK